MAILYEKSTIKRKLILDYFECDIGIKKLRMKNRRTEPALINLPTAGLNFNFDKESVDGRKVGNCLETVLNHYIRSRKYN